MSGTLIELLLLEHFDDWWQQVPLVLLGLGLAAITWHAYAGSVTSERALGGLMALFVLGGCAGLVLHFQGNAEFEREQNAALGGWALVREAMMGATPALAPGAMIQFGLMGVLNCS